MNALRKIYNYLISRYTKIQLLIILVVIAFGFIITDSSIFARIMYDSKIRELESQVEYYKEKTEEDKKKLEEIQDDRDHVEKFARENYYMKKENEDVYATEQNK